MKILQNIIILAGVVVIALLILGRMSPGLETSQSVVDTPEEQVVELPSVGVLAPLSGDFAFYGEDIRDGVLVGFEGLGVEVIAEDTACDPATTVSAYQKLVNIDKVQLIIGPGCGSPQEAIAPLVAQDDVVVMLPSAASQDLFASSGGKMFNIQYSLEAESAYNARVMGDAGFTRVGLVHYQNAFSQTHAKAFREAFAGEVVEIAFGELGDDVATGILKAEHELVEALYIADMSFFFTQGMDKLAQVGLDIPVYSMYAVELPVARPLVEGVIYSFPAEITGAEGGTFELSKAAGESFGTRLGTACTEFDCVLENLRAADSGFGPDGVFVRDIMSKQIVGGAVTGLE